MLALSDRSLQVPSFKPLKEKRQSISGEFLSLEILHEVLLDCRSNIHIQDQENFSIETQIRLALLNPIEFQKYNEIHTQGVNDMGRLYLHMLSCIEPLKTSTVIHKSNFTGSSGARQRVWQWSKFARSADVNHIPNMQSSLQYLRMKLQDGFRVSHPYTDISKVQSIISNLIMDTSSVSGIEIL